MNNPRIVSRKTLLTVSAIADALDLLGFGLLPGPWSLLIDLPVTVIHFLYAGPKAFVVLAEYIPGVGFLPCYTMAAWFYAKHEDGVIDLTTSTPPGQRQVSDHESGRR